MKSAEHYDRYRFALFYFISFHQHLFFHLSLCSSISLLISISFQSLSLFISASVSFHFYLFLCSSLFLPLLIGVCIVLCFSFSFSIFVSLSSLFNSLLLFSFSLPVHISSVSLLNDLPCWANMFASCKKWSLGVLARATRCEVRLYLRCVVCRVCGGAVVRWCVWCVWCVWSRREVYDMSLTICHNSPAPNYGSHVPVDTAPGPASVCRALKIRHLIPAVKTDSWNLSLRQHSDVHQRR